MFDQEHPVQVDGESRGQVSVDSKWYGSSLELYPALAEEARKHGANVVVNVESYHAPSGFSWAAPHLQGLAMRVTDTKALRGAGVPFREF